MKLLLAVLGLALAGTAPSLAQSAQLLSVNLRGDGAQATQLAQYDPGAPIVVRVTDGEGRPPDTLSIVASGPAGEQLRIPLTRATDGTFGGTFTLSDEGSWRLNLISSSANVRAESTPVMLSVQAPPPSNAWLIGLGVGAVIFVVIGGTGFALLRRAAENAPAPDLGNAA